MTPVEFLTDKPWDQRNWLEKSYPVAVFEAPPVNSLTYADKDQADGVLAVPAGINNEEVIWNAHYYDGAAWRVIGFEHKPITYFSPVEALHDARLARNERLEADYAEEQRGDER